MITFKKNICIIIFIFNIILLFRQNPAAAFWIWTPETNKWVNPKYAVKDTPQEQLNVGLELYTSKDYAQAINELRKLLKHYPLAKEAPEAQYYIALCQEEQGKIYESFKSYQVVIDKYPFSERAAEIIQKQYAIGLKMLEGESNQGVLKQTFSADDSNVVEVFQAVIKNAPYGELAPLAQYKIGLYMLEKKLYVEARDELEKVVNDYPNSEWAKAAKYQIAVTDAQRSVDAPYDQKITQAAVEEFKEFNKSFPDAELSQKAKEQIALLREKEAENHYLIAQFYEKRKNFSAAKVYYQIILEEYQDSTWFSKALDRMRAFNVHP